MRVTVDTNLVVSAFLWGGNPSRVLAAARVGVIDIYTTRVLLAELTVVLSRDKVEQRLIAVNLANMSNSVYSEINFHITWHTKTSLPMINERIESRLYHYLTHKILETPGARLHAIGGIETHIHLAASLQPNILVSDWIGN